MGFGEVGTRRRLLLDLKMSRAAGETYSVLLRSR